jgi:ComF family protein
MAFSMGEEGAAAWAVRGRKALAGVARRALDLIFPPSCLACRKAVDAAGGLCPTCWRAMRFIERPFCERLGTPFATDYGGPLLSPAAIADPPVYQRARAVARFEDGPARRLVHRLKYSDRTDLAGFMPTWMARAGAELLAECDVVAPVPLHPGRLLRRQFNQAAALAAGVASAARRPYAPQALKRVKATRSQVGLSRVQRAENVQGAFQPGETDALRDRRVLLVDDVMTSGATANAASRALLRAGATAVDVVVFARVVTDA